MKLLLVVSALISVSVGSAGVTPAPYLDDYKSTTVSAESEPVPVLPVLPESEGLILSPVLQPIPMVVQPVESFIPNQIEEPFPDAITPILPSLEPISSRPEFVDPGQEVILTRSPLIQILLNIRSDTVQTPEPVSVVETAEDVTPVIVVESAPEAVQVVEPVIVVENTSVVEPIQVIEAAPIAVEPVIIGTPIIPSPAVVLPEELN